MTWAEWVNSEYSNALHVTKICSSCGSSMEFGIHSGSIISHDIIGYSNSIGCAVYLRAGSQILYPTTKINDAGYIAYDFAAICND